MTRTNRLLKMAIWIGAIGCWNCGAARLARADDPDAKFQIKNTLDEKVSVFVASEKSTKSPPWAHVDMDPGAVQTILLHAPDPYTVHGGRGGCSGAFPSRSRSRSFLLNIRTTC